jgi:hypothetical protein
MSIPLRVKNAQIKVNILQVSLYAQKAYAD